MLRLDPDLEPWERQPGESSARYGQFATYRDLGRRRTLRAAAELLGRSYAHVRQVAADGLWRTRAEAWDAEQDRAAAVHRAELSRAAADSDAQVVSLARRRALEWLAALDPARLSAGEGIRLLDAALRHSRALFGDPLEGLELPRTDAEERLRLIEAEQAEAAALPLDQAVAEFELELAKLRARQAAVSGLDDD